MKILFLEKVFLKEKKEDKLRGVELFNLSFILDLSKLGFDIKIIAHESWRKCFEERIKKDNIFVKYFNKGCPASIGVKGVFSFRKEKFDTLFLANAGDTLIGAMLLSKILRTSKKQVLLAHREPTKMFLMACKLVSIHAVSVNRKIASHFQKIKAPLNEVYYGIKNADDFLKLQTKKDHEKIVFGVVGDLDNKWKGADTAIDAFKMLSQESQSKCELKLASYTNNFPQGLPENIKAYSWMPYSEMVNFYNSLDVLIVPSYDEKVMRETFSQAMVQGMLSGLPILANDLPILNEKLDNGGGFTFNSVEKLKEKIEELIFNAPLRVYLGEKARKIASERYIWDSNHMAKWF